MSYGRTKANTVPETWVLEGLKQLIELDSDHASEMNGQGFNKTDGAFGRSLYYQLAERGLTEKQWAAAKRLCTKYRRQIGDCPEEEIPNEF